MDLYSICFELLKYLPFLFPEIEVQNVHHLLGCVEIYNYNDCFSLCLS
jgi:hypothetical protein